MNEDAVAVLDSITEVGPEHEGMIVVTGSHGGVSVARYAAAVPALIYVFNDAGIGRNGAGVAALAVLDRAGIAAATVAHTSACIGDASDTLQCGIINRANRIAVLFGVEDGMQVRDLPALLAATS